MESMNYLVQASENVSGVAPSLSHYYGFVLKTVAEKSTAKLDFTIKRWICKGCRVILVPGINCTYRLRKKKSSKKHPSQIITCGNCSTVRSLILHPTVKQKSNYLVEHNIPSSCVVDMQEVTITS